LYFSATLPFTFHRQPPPASITRPPHSSQLTAHSAQRTAPHQDRPRTSTFFFISSEPP
jgi:hypothetical protein